MEGADRQALEAKWRERLENARTRYEAARAAVQGARESQHAPDDSFVLDNALRAEHHALTEFNRVTRILNDLVAHGTIPEEE